MPAPPSLVSVNVGRPRTIGTGRRTITTSIWKDPVEGPVRAAGINLEGDEQADRQVHGGPDKAVYAYAVEDVAWWEGQLGRPLGPGIFGQNLDVSGLDVSGALVGDRWRIGSVLLEVRQPRLPCFKLALRMDDPRFVKRFGAAGRPGAYFSILEDGTLQAGDPVEVVDRPAHEITMRVFAEAYLRDHDRLPELLSVPALPDQWRSWIEERVA